MIEFMEFESLELLDEFVDFMIVIVGEVWENFDILKLVFFMFVVVRMDEI